MTKGISVLGMKHIHNQAMHAMIHYTCTVHDKFISPSVVDKCMHLLNLAAV